MGWVTDKGGGSVQKFKEGGKVKKTPMHDGRLRKTGEAKKDAMKEAFKAEGEKKEGKAGKKEAFKEAGKKGGTKKSPGLKEKTWKKFKKPKKKKAKLVKLEDGGQINRLGESIKTKRGGGHKYKKVTAEELQKVYSGSEDDAHYPRTSDWVMVEQDLDETEELARKQEERRKRSEARIAEAKAIEDAKQRARDKADLEAYEEYQKTKGPNDPSYQP